MCCVEKSQTENICSWYCSPMQHLDIYTFIGLYFLQIKKHYPKKYIFIINQFYVFFKEKH